MHLCVFVWERETPHRYGHKVNQHELYGRYQCIKKPYRVRYYQYVYVAIGTKFELLITFSTMHNATRFLEYPFL